MSTYRFRGFNFLDINFTPMELDSGDAVQRGAQGSVYNKIEMLSTGDADFDALVETIAYANGAPTGIKNGRVTLSGLTGGKKYKIQVFYNDQRGAGNSHTLVLGDGTGAAMVVAANAVPGAQGNDYGQHAVGCFTADAATQTLILKSSSGNIHVNAILLVEDDAEASKTLTLGLIL